MPVITDLTGLITGIGIYFADPGATGTFEYMCGMNGRGVDQTRERKTETAVLDCGPDASIETLASAGAYDWSISGDASMQLKTFDFLAEWMTEGGEREIIVIYYTGPKGAREAYSHIKGSAILTQFGTNQGDAEGLMTASIAISKAGPSVYARGIPSGVSLTPTMPVAP